MRKRSGFTLIEILVGVGLFAILSVAGFAFMQSSMNSTLRQKTQQQANDNAKAMLSAVTTELKSSYREPASLILEGKSGDPLYSYKSSVIYPATAQASTCVGNNATTSVNDIPTPPSAGTAEGLNAILANSNQLAFYIRTNNEKFRVVRYLVVVENGLCRLDRLVYKWDNVNKWSGLTWTSGTTIGVDSFDVRFSSGNLGTRIDSERSTVASLPSRGDAAILYVARSLDDNYGVTKLSANQYFVKVIVFQTLRALESGYVSDTGLYNPVQYTTGRYPLSLFLLNNPTGDNLKKKQNYRVAEIDGIVNVTY